MEKNLLKQSGIIAVIVTFLALAFWLGFAKISLGIDTSNWTPYAMKKNSVVSEQLIIMCGTSGSGIVFGTTSAVWVGTPTDSTLARIGLNTGTGKLEIKNAGTDTASPIVKYHDDLSGVTANQHHAQAHGAADHSSNIGAESQITFGTQTGHAHTGTDSTKVQHSQLAGMTANDHHAQTHGASDHSGNIGTESQIAYGTETGHAHTGTDSTKVSYPNLLNRSHGAADHTGNIGTESQIAYGTASGHSHNGIDSTKIDYDTSPVELGTETAGNSDNISEGSTNKYYTDDRVATVIGSSSITSPQVSPRIILTSPAVGQFLKILNIQGDVENGTSSASVDFSAVTGSASASQLPLLSGLLGTVTSAQLPLIHELIDTTTTITGTTTYWRWYNFKETGIVIVEAVYIAETGGTASASSVNPSYPAINAFDGTTTTLWASQDPGFPITIQYQYPQQYIFNSVRLWNANADWGTFTVQASNNGTDFDSLGNFMSGTTTDNTLQTFDFSNSSPYSYWRLNHTSNPYRGDSYSGLREIDFGYQEYEDTYNHYSIQFIPPGTITPALSLVGNGTVSAELYLVANVTTAIFGLGTTTAITGTASSYAGWFDGAVRVEAIYVASTEEIKKNIKSIKTKPDWLDAEAEAKIKYSSDNRDAWITSNQANYKYIGSNTAAYIDTTSMETDYTNYIELEWASDLNQNTYTRNVQKGYEKAFWYNHDAMSPKSWNPIDNPNLTRRGFIAEEVPPEVRGIGLTVCPMALIAYLTEASQSLKEEAVFALSTLQELITTGTVTQQKVDDIAYRLDVLNP